MSEKEALGPTVLLIPNRTIPTRINRAFQQAPDPVNTRPALSFAKLKKHPAILAKSQRLALGVGK
jgi:hypothetical protein